MNSENREEIKFQNKIYTVSGKRKKRENRSIDFGFVRLFQQLGFTFHIDMIFNFFNVFFVVVVIFHILTIPYSSQRFTHTRARKENLKWPSSSKCFEMDSTKSQEIFITRSQTIFTYNSNNKYKEHQ